MAFLTLSMAEIFHSFNMRSQRDSLLHMKYMNPPLIWSSIASFAATTLVIYVPFFIFIEHPIPKFCGSQFQLMIDQFYHCRMRRCM